MCQGEALRIAKAELRFWRLLQVPLQYCRILFDQPVIAVRWNGAICNSHRDRPSPRGGPLVYRLL